MNNKNILLGYSGHAYVVLDAANEAGIAINHYADKKEASDNPFNLEYLGYEGNSDFMGWDEQYNFILGIGDNRIRAKLAALIKQKNKNLLKVIHPASKISQNVKIGDGTFLAPHVAVNVLSEIGEFVILNTGSIIEHECSIADGVHIAPGAVLAGNVNIGKRSFIGANAVIKEGVTVGDDVIVGAGATIIKNIPSGNKVVGNPGRTI